MQGTIRSALAVRRRGVRASRALRRNLEGCLFALRGQQSPKDALDGVAQKWTQLLNEGYGAKS